MIKTYSLLKDGETQLSKNFKVKEFKQQDGKCDTVLIDEELVAVLQQLRNHFGAAVHINSAYRSPEYNAAVGGSSKSQHCQGTAADIWIDKVEPLQIALYLSSLDFFKEHGGIGLYSRSSSVYAGFVHVDTRAKKSRWISRVSTKYTAVSAIMPILRRGSRDNIDGVSYAVTVLQRHLGVTADGIFGTATKTAVIEFQKKNGLTADGVVGSKTWAKL